MANWAKLQEDLVGLPVAKRARHGIHFQKSANEFVANFSGKPCHYEDGGIWKPIDTKLLATSGGFYGSPHSDVKIHPDGRVKVDKSDYQQFTELPSAKAGVLSGDRIIRTFPGGEQHLIMKEDGFREEIHVFKPTFPLEKFIAKTQGSLPSKYKAHPVTAEDADGNTYEFTGDVAAFGKWLDAAKYPVVIDPDFTSATGGGGDTGLSPFSPTRNYGTAITMGTGTVQGAWLLRFDISEIAAGSTPTAASLKITKTFATSTGANTTSIYGVKAANGDWVEGTKYHTDAGAGEPCWDAKKADGAGGVTTAWAGAEGCQTAGTDYETDAYGSFDWNREDLDGTQYTITFNAAGITCVGTWFGANTYNYGLIFPTSIRMSSYGRFAASEYATESYRPVLSVTYTAGGVPKHYLHYARLRG